MARCSGRIEQTYGVPGEVLVAIWGLETDFGVNIGKFPTIRSLATLAYDCRRSETFRGRIDGRAAHRRARRSRAVGNARRLGRRNRPDPVHAVVLHQISPSISTATAAATCCAARPMCWPRPRTSLPSYGWQRGKDWEPGSAEFRGDPAMEQERGLRQDDRVFRDPARARALSIARANTSPKGRSRATGHLPSDRLPCSGGLLRSCPHASPCSRCIAHAPILPSSIAVCASAISFCATILPSPSAMASIMVSVFVMFSPLQPAIILCGGCRDDSQCNGSHCGCSE